MKNKKRWMKISILLLSIVLLSPLSNYIKPAVYADEPLRLVVDGKDVTASAVPVIQNARTLVP